MENSHSGAGDFVTKHSKLLGLNIWYNISSEVAKQ